MSGYDTATPYVAAYVLLRDGDKVAFVLREHTGWMDNHYGLPSGKVEKNEPYTVAAIREAYEEVGVQIAAEHLHHAITIYRRAPDSDWVDVYFEVDKWQGEVINAEPEKHSALEWLTITNLPENVIPAVRYALEQIAVGASFAEEGWD